jgi:membrane protease YdiL (CAAX protease family)
MTHGFLARHWVLWLGIPFEISLAGIAYLLGCFFGQPLLERWNWNAGDAAVGAAGSLPLLLAFTLLFHLPAAPFVRLRRFFDEIVRPLMASCTVAELAGLSLAAGVGEEALFRCVLQPTFSTWLGTGIGLALASVLFGCLHPFSLTYFLIATLFGVYLGGLWLATDNLLVVAIAHAFYDFLVLIYLLRRSPSL